MPQCNAWCVFLLCLLIKPGNAGWVNVALDKPTQQRGDLWDSHNAVDGILADTESQECSGTLSQSDSWWMVDLLQTFHVRHVRIQNRPGSESLKNFDIYVSKSDPVPRLKKADPLEGDLCLHHHETLPSGDIQDLYCYMETFLFGRYVYVWKRGNGILSLCEVEVWTSDGIGEHVVGSMVFSGHSVPKSPFYHEVIGPVLPETCCLICMTRIEDLATHFTVNRQTGDCNCMSYPTPVSDYYQSADNNTDFWEIPYM